MGFGPTKSHYDTIIVGGGNAAGYAAFHYVEGQGPRDELLILSNEPHVPYERPALSKGFLAPVSPARLSGSSGFYTCLGAGGPACTPTWYEERGIHVALDTQVKTLDPERKVVRTEANVEFSYTRLILATGVRPRTLGDVAYPNCFYLRNYEDGLALYDTMSRLKEEGQSTASTRPKKVVVVGAGYIGLECTAALRQFGLSVELVYPHAHFMSRFWPAEIASYYEHLYASEHGVTLTPNQRVTGFQLSKENLVQDVVCQDGSVLTCDAVILGIGDQPNVEFLHNQLTLAKGGGVQVNARLETSAEGIYAIGDIAAFPYASGHDYIRLAHVDNARKMAKFVMHQILSPNERSTGYTVMPYFYSRVFDCAWKFYGETTDDVICFVVGEESNRRPGAYWINQAAQVVGCFLEGGSTQENDSMKACVSARPSLSAETTHAQVRAQGIAFALQYGPTQ